MLSPFLFKKTITALLVGKEAEINNEKRNLSVNNTWNVFEFAGLD